MISTPRVPGCAPPIDPPILAYAAQNGARVRVVRDDVLPGGTKMRFLLAFLQQSRITHAVYGAPFCGGAPVALAHAAKQLGIRATIFYAQRAATALHTRQQQVLRLGAHVVWVPMGFMSHVQFRVRAFCDETGATRLPLGFDTPEAYPLLIASLRRVAPLLDPPASEIWCAASTGMLTACLARAFPETPIHAVTVGADSYRRDRARFPPTITWHASRYAYAHASRAHVPFPACPNYEAKAWEICTAQARDGALFWNVIGDA